MSIVQRVSRWLGRLSVGRKLMLIYLLDLTAVIYVSSILIHEKFIAIDFTRKEIVGTAYASVVRDALLDAFLHEEGRPPTLVVERLESVRAQYDAQLKTAEGAQRFEAMLRQPHPVPAPGAELAPIDSGRAGLLREGRELLTTVGNQSNLILDPDLDSYYVMSLILLRFPELLQVTHDIAGFLNQPARAGASTHRSAELLTLAGRLDAVMVGIDSDYNQAFIAGSPALRAALAQQRQALAASGAGFQALCSPSPRAPRRRPRPICPIASGSCSAICRSPGSRARCSSKACCGPAWRTSSRACGCTWARRCCCWAAS